jgi:hypothetical protein
VGDPAGPEHGGGGAASGRSVPIRDRDSKYSGPFDEVFRTEGTRASRPRSTPRRRTRSPSRGSGRLATSASTTSWSSADATSSEPFGSSLPITKPSGRTGTEVRTSLASDVIEFGKQRRRGS